jgi:hypothetical protein
MSPLVVMMCFDGHLAFLKRKTLCMAEMILAHEGGALGGPMTSSLCSMTRYKYQNVTLERVNVIFRVSYVQFFKLNLNLMM